MQHEPAAAIGAGHVAGAHEGGEGGVDFGGYAAALFEGAAEHDGVEGARGGGELPTARRVTSVEPRR